ncbi:HD domain-containing protein [Candidatus Micrarchaeota archaeon]|nr:HD domain-containing protein [Candidatus Micrarchaeota archaeon]
MTSEQLLAQIGVDFPTDSRLNGVSGFIACLESATSDDQIKNAMAQLMNGGESVGSGSENVASCAGRFQEDTDKIILSSSVIGLESGTIDNDFMYDPVIAALLQLYNLKSPPSRSLFEERISNSIVNAADRRHHSAYSFLDFAFLKYRFGSDKDLAPYFLETQLSDDDRIGIRLLAACVKENAPLGSVASFAIRGELPSDAFILNLRCLYAAGFDTKAPTYEQLERNFIRLANAVMGRNVLLHRNNNVIPSVVKDTMFYTADQQFIPVGQTRRDEAVAEILSIDEFVNVHVAGLRKTMSSYQNFKGTYKLDNEKKLILADIQLQRFKKSHADAIRTDTKWKITEQIAKTFSDGVMSCAVGAVTGEAVGYGVGYVLAASSKVPYLRAVTFTLGGAFILYSIKDAGDEVVELYQNYKEIPTRSDLVSKLCDTASNAWGFAHGFNFKEFFSKAREKGSMVDGDVPASITPEIPKTGVPAVAAVQPQTKGQILANVISTMAQQDKQNFAAGKEYLKQVQAWVKSKLNKPIPGAPEVPKPPLDGLNQIRMESPEIAVRALFDRVEQIKNDPARTELKRAAESPDPVVASEARAKIRQNDREVTAELLEISGLNERILITETPAGRHFYYWPKQAGNFKVPKDIADKFSKFLDLAKDAGIDVRAKPHSDGVLLSTSSDVLDRLGKDFEKNWDCKKASLSPFESPSAGFRKLSFDMGIACPREDALYDEFRRLLYPDTAMGRGAWSDTKVLVSQLAAVREFRSSLRDEKANVFDEVYALLKDPDSFEDVPGGVKRVLELRKERAGTDPEWEDFALKLTLAMDSQIDPSIHVFGRHARFLQSAASTKPIQATKLREAKDIRKAQEIEKEYTADVISAMIESHDLSTPTLPGQPILSDNAFKSVFERYGNAGEDDLALFTAFNKGFTEHLDSTLKDLSNSKKLTLLNQIEQISSTRLAAGENRVAHLVQVRLKGQSKPLKFIAKIGPTTPGELALYKEWREAGFATRIFGHVDGPKRTVDLNDPKTLKDSLQSVVLQEFVDGTTIRDTTDKDTIVDSTAELWASQAAATHTEGPDGGSMTFIHDFYENFRFKKEDGKALIFDAELRQMSPRTLKQFLFYMLAYSDMHFNEAQLSRFLRQFAGRFSEKSGVPESVIQQALRELRTEIKENYLGLAVKFQTPDGKYVGERKFLNHLLIDYLAAANQSNLPIAQRLNNVIDDVVGKSADDGVNAPSKPSSGNDPVPKDPVAPVVRFDDKIQEFTESHQFLQSDRGKPLAAVFKEYPEEMSRFIAKFDSVATDQDFAGSVGVKDRVLKRTFELLADQHADDIKFYVSHGADHGVRVAELSYQLAESYAPIHESIISRYGLDVLEAGGKVGRAKEASGAIVMFLGLLHDVGYSELAKYEVAHGVSLEKFTHAEVGARMVKALFQHEGGLFDGLPAAKRDLLKNDFVEAVAKHNHDSPSNDVFHGGQIAEVHVDHDLVHLHAGETLQRGFTTADVENKPLLFTIRVADNLDFQYDRLSGFQRQESFELALQELRDDPRILVLTEKKGKTAAEKTQLTQLVKDKIVANEQKYKGTMSDAEWSEAKDALFHSNAESFLHFYSNWVVQDIEFRPEAGKLVMFIKFRSSNIKADSGDMLYQVTRMSTAMSSCSSHGTSCANFLVVDANFGDLANQKDLSVFSKSSGGLTNTPSGRLHMHLPVSELNAKTSSNPDLTEELTEVSEELNPGFDPAIQIPVDYGTTCANGCN